MENSTRELAISNLKNQLPEGFKLITREDEKTEVILNDQDHFSGWNSILLALNNNIFESIKLYDVEGKDDVYTEIRNSLIIKSEIENESLRIKFDEKDVDAKDLAYLKKSDVVALKHIMMPWKNKLLICHKGMLRSVSF